MDFMESVTNKSNQFHPLKLRQAVLSKDPDKSDLTNYNKTAWGASHQSLLASLTPSHFYPLFHNMSIHKPEVTTCSIKWHSGKMESDG